MAALVSPVLVGRRRELDALETAYRRALAGQPSVVLVGGEAGVGKTRLVEDTVPALAAADGARLLTGGCAELGGEAVPFAPLVDVLRTLAASTDADELEELLGPARDELARLLPTLGPAVPGPLPSSVDETARLFELVLGVVTRLAAQRPLILVFEDLHWADRATLDLVAFLVRTLRAGPVLLVATYRTEEIHRRHPLRPLLVSLERVRAVDRL